jgi:UDP:flavonoid glycosyltransferase YjiC (YdhE family)
MSARVVAIFCMPERGHLQRLLPLVAGLARRGVDAQVFTDVAFRAPVERVGGRLVDLFERYPLDAADATSRPVPCRYVTFAAHYAAPLIEEIARLKPSVIVYDTFAVIGLVLGRWLSIPYVNVCAGHNMSPANAIASLEHERRAALSPACLRAIDVLRSRWGIHDAGPYSYITGLSPFLNVYCEPPEFLRPEERRAFEPVAFFGSILPLEMVGHHLDGMEAVLDRHDGARVRVYASFGSVVWRYYEADALQALVALSDELGAMRHARTLVSLGGHRLGRAARAGLERSNVWVADYVDQRRVLESASVCVTHQGLNSTHEAVYHGVPMISYPFFGDQPGLAARCQEHGLAVPLVPGLRGVVRRNHVRDALDRLIDQSAQMEARLVTARTWETDVMNGRGAVIERILGLA